MDFLGDYELAFLPLFPSLISSKIIVLQILAELMYCLYPYDSLNTVGNYQDHGIPVPSLDNLEFFSRVYNHIFSWFS